jgi:tetratricopeptide (TPR) repeat protein
MAAEQATGRRGSITTATDVYGLGAVLYATLTGRPPFQAPSTLETIELVKSHDPDPPSSLNPRVDRDLQTICLKCLDKTPDRRYPSALSLADDLDHWLRGEPISARPIGRPERTWRWCRRNPVVAGLTAAVLSLLVAGFVGLLVSNAMIAHRNAQLVQQRDDLKAANETTKRALDESETSRRDAEAAKDFLFEAFESPNPYENGKREVKVAEMLDRAAAKLEREFTGSPRVKGLLLIAIGKTYSGLGEPRQAAKMFEKASMVLQASLGPDHPDTLTGRNNLAQAYLAAGRTREAIALHEATLKARESRLGPDHPTTLAIRNSLAEAYFAAGRARGDRASRGDAQGTRVGAGARPPHHAHQPRQPRHGLRVHRSLG